VDLDVDVDVDVVLIGKRDWSLQKFCLQDNVKVKEPLHSGLPSPASLCYYKNLQTDQSENEKNYIFQSWSVHSLKVIYELLIPSPIK
jgi:hypothetical protein